MKFIALLLETRIELYLSQPFCIKLSALYCTVLLTPVHDVVTQYLSIFIWSDVQDNEN